MVTSLSFSPNGTRLLSAGQEQGKNIRIWNMSNGWETGSFQKGGSSIQTIVVGTDGKYFFTGQVAQSINIWGAPE
jgi:WD40 repeat protein